MTNRAEVLSYGGGVQSVTMCIMAANGELPRPDHIIIADTGREAQSTWDYMSTTVQPIMEAAGLRIEIASHDLATVDLYAHNGDLLIPAFTRQGDNPEVGKLPTFCSNEWKQRVVMRYLRSVGVKECNVWMGYTIDEIERVKPSAVKWFRRTYPLINGPRTMSRADCLAYLEYHNLPRPMKSACFMCPLRTNTEWMELKERYPSEYRKAVQLESSIRQRDPDAYLHRQGVPLPEVDYAVPDAQEDAQCSLGFCMT
jgi:hypothetical protein